MLNHHFFCFAQDEEMEIRRMHELVEQTTQVLQQADPTGSSCGHEGRAGLKMLQLQTVLKWNVFLEDWLLSNCPSRIACFQTAQGTPKSMCKTYAALRRSLDQQARNELIALNQRQRSESSGASTEVDVDAADAAGGW